MVYTRIMALKNAFANLGTENALRRIVNLLTFSRDSADRIRVVIDNQPAQTVYNRNTSTNMTADASVQYQTSSSWNSVDAREPLKLSHAARADFVKKNRWTY